MQPSCTVTVPQPPCPCPNSLWRAPDSESKEFIGYVVIAYVVTTLADIFIHALILMIVTIENFDWLFVQLGIVD